MNKKKDLELKNKAREKITNNWGCYTLLWQQNNPDEIFEKYCTQCTVKYSDDCPIIFNITKEVIKK